MEVPISIGCHCSRRHSVSVALYFGVKPFARLVISNGARESKISDIEEWAKQYILVEGMY
jgi:hypothetical protein